MKVRSGYPAKWIDLIYYVDLVEDGGYERCSKT